MADLTMYRGDARTITVDIELEGVAWEVPVGATVRMTAKKSTNNTDAQAVFAKHSGVDGGITVDGAVATVELVADDTSELTTVQDLQCDVQVAGDDFGPWTVARFVLRVNPDVTITTP